MRRSETLLAAAFLGVASSVPFNAWANEGQAIETFRCESRDHRHHECRYNASGTVTVHVKRQLSKSNCEFNRDWGTYDGGVWVDNGCRAEFVVKRPPGMHQGGMANSLTCESRNHDRVDCRVSGIDPGSVRIERQLSHSACNRGSTWGVSEGENSPPGIWVDKGCRATFAYSTRGGHMGGGSGHSGSGASLDHGGRIRNICAAAVARQVGVSPNDVVVTRSTISEGTGNHVIYVGVPRATADWVCEADRHGNVLNVYFGGEG